MPSFNRSFSGGGSRAVVTDLEVDPADSTVSVDETNNRLGIGTTTPGTQLELDGETPYITLKNSTAENTDGGCETKLIFEDHAAASLGQIEVNHSGSSDDTKGKMVLSTHTGSTLTAAVTIDEAQKVTAAGDVQVTGDIILDDGGSLKEAGGTAAITFDGSGHVTKIGQDSPSSADVLTYDGAKWVAEAPTVGDITGVTAGDGLTGGGTTGALSLAVGAGTGIDVATDAISVDVSDFMTNGVDNRVLTATGSDAMNAEAKLTFDGQTLLIDTDVTDTTTHTTVGAHIDYDATGIVATGQTGNNVGLDVDLNSNSPTMVGTVNNTGLDIDLTGGTSGTQKNVGIDVNVTGADTNYSAILNGGNVGIGTSAPSTLVHAAGSDPYLALQNTTAENTDGGCESKIIFGDHSGATLGQFQVSHEGSSDDTKGKMTLSVHSGSSLLDTIEMKEGNITKLGQSSPSSGQFLKYDGAKWVADTVSGTVAGSVAADDITVGDAAINLATSSGNITIDAQAGDADIIFKGTDDSSDITALTLDMSEAGAAAFNSAVSVGTDLTVTGGDIAFGATNSSVTVGATAHDAAGANLTISAGSTTASTSDDQAGGSLTVSGGQGKGTGAGGDIVFKTANAGTSGSSLNSLATALTIDQARKATFTSTSTNSIVIDQDFSVVDASSVVGLDIDIDKTGSTTTNNSMIGLNLDMDNTSATNGTNTMTGMKVTPTLVHAADAGTTLAKGIEVVVTGGTPGGSTARALDLTATGADFNQGIFMAIADGGPDIKMVSSADAGDFATIAVGAAGATTITTVDDGGATAHLTFDVDGNIILDSNEGAWRFKKDGGTKLKVDTGNGGDITFENDTQDKDIIFAGDDNGSGITALTLDMSEAGAAAFNSTVTATGFIIGSASISEAELEIIDGATVTTTELNLLDGDTSVGGSVTIADDDGFIFNDGGTMKTIPASDIKTYAGGGTAADDSNLILHMQVFA